MTYYLITAWLVCWVLTLWVATKANFDRSRNLSWCAGPIALPLWPVILPMLTLIVVYDVKHRQ